MDPKRARFDWQVVPHLDAAYRFAFALARNRAEAEDLLQEAALRAYRALDTLRGEQAKPWLLTIVRNCFLSARAQAHRVASVPLPQGAWCEGHASLIDPAPSPEQAVLDEGERRAMGETLAELGEEHREVLMLREVEELSYREIALVLGVPIGTVMSRLARARAALKATWLNRQAREVFP